MHTLVVSTPVPPTRTPHPSRTPAATRTATPPRTATPRPTHAPGPSRTPAPIAEPVLPTPPATPPVVIDRIADPDAWSGLSLDADADRLEVVFPPVRDCDAILLRCGGETLLIDCGSHAFEESVLIMLDYLGVSRIDTIVITHPHHDHVEGFAAIADHVRVGRVLVSFPDDYNAHMPRLLAAARVRRVPVARYGDGDVFTLGGATLTVYDRSPEDYGCNDRSAQLLLRYGRRTMLFTADIERPGMLALAESVEEGELRADILKYPHHGKAALPESFFRAVQPSFAVVTNKDRGWDGQLWLNLRRIPYVNTRVGGVVLTTDGRDHWIAERLYSRDDVRGR